MGASATKGAKNDVNPPLLRSRGRQSNREIAVSNVIEASSTKEAKNDVDPLVRSHAAREIFVSKTNSNCWLTDADRDRSIERVSQ